MTNQSTTQLTLPRALQMELVAAAERRDQGAIRRAMQTNPRLSEAIASFVLALQFFNDPHDASSSVSDDVVERGLARGLARIQHATSPNLSQVMKAAGKTKPQLAGALHLGSNVINLLTEGRIALTTIPRRFFAQLAEALQTTVDEVTRAVESSFAAPAFARDRLGKPASEIHDFAQAIRNSPEMSDEDRAAWLTTDA